jgi:hypothetical protein
MRSCVRLSVLFTVASSLSVAKADPAQPVWKFTQSMGVNTHIDSQTPYYSVPKIREDLIYLGMSLIRDSLEIANRNVQRFDQIMSIPHMRVAAGMPYRVTDIQAELTAPLKAFLRHWPGRILAYEGPNEPNVFGFEYRPRTDTGAEYLERVGRCDQKTTYLPCANAVRDAYAAFKSDPVLKTLIFSTLTDAGAEPDNSGVQCMVIGRSDCAGGALLPDGTQFADAITVHPYMTHYWEWPWAQSDSSGASRNELTANNHRTWLRGFHGYPRDLLAGLPRRATETGTDSRAGNDKMGRQALDLFADFFKNGWMDVEWYQLYDQQPCSEFGDDQCNDGLFTSPGRPKIAATYLHNQSVILRDVPKSFTPGVLGNSLTGGDRDTHDMLLQKSDGSYWWAIWGEGDGHSVDVTARFGENASDIRVYDPTVGTRPVSTPPDGSSISLKVTDHPLYVAFKTGSGGPGSKD